MKRFYKLLLGLQLVADDFLDWSVGFFIYRGVMEYRDLDCFYMAILCSFFISWFSSNSKRKQLYHDMNL